MPRLSLERLHDYLLLCNPDDDPSDLAADHERILAMVARGDRDLRRTFVAIDDDDPELPLIAAIRLFPNQAGQLALSRPIFVDILERDILAARLLDEVMDHLLSSEPDIDSVGCRVHEPSRATSMKQLLLERGFVELGGRIEYKTPVATLPPELPDSPFSWKDMNEVGFAEIARMLAVAAEGAPDWDEGEDPEEAIQGYLDDPELTSDPRYFQIGFIDGEPAAFIVAQIDPSDGWSRLSYMAGRRLDVRASRVCPKGAM